MNVVLLNLILTTAENGVIKRRKTIKDTMISNCAMGFVKAGHHVTILASEEFKPAEEETYDYNIIYFKSGLKRLFKPYLIPYPVGMYSYLKRNRSNIDLIVSSEAFSIGTLIAAMACRSKLEIWQEMAYHQRKWHKLPSLLWHNLVVRTVLRNVLVVPRSEPAGRFIARYSANVSGTLVDHGANGDVLRPATDGPTDSFIVVSQLVERKNVAHIIRAFARLVAMPAYSHYRLHIIGDGNQAEALRQLARQLGVDGNVEFHGFMLHSQMAELLRHARAMLIATRRDLNMVSIPESIVSGTPIVTNTCPTSASFIARHGLGVVRDGWDETDLIKAIDHYTEFHKACLRERDGLTREGCANKLVKLYVDNCQKRACGTK